jgi:hypothetical protein
MKTSRFHRTIIGASLLFCLLGFVLIISGSTVSFADTPFCDYDKICTINGGAGLCTHGSINPNVCVCYDVVMQQEEVTLNCWILPNPDSVTPELCTS